MCGIVGVFSFDGTSPDFKTIRKMSQTLAHRGPDESGIAVHGCSSIANQRLSIVDIDHGQQPFYSADKKFVVVQNGEIFNFVELRADLIKAGKVFKTKSDTEVILQAFLFWGENFVNHLNGMFAIAIFDIDSEKLFLFRDRLGVKPLFFYKDSKRLFFASEIKAILAADVPRKVNYRAIHHYLSFNYVPPPLTLFEEIEHLPPGSFLEVTKQETRLNYWWKLSNVSPAELTERDAVSKIKNILDDATFLRMRADVEVGAFLSGGVDSSSVVEAAVRTCSEKNLKTFSIGFNDKRYDESYYSKLASEKFKTHHYLEIANPEIIQDWPLTTYFCDQPHGDVSFLPTYYLSRLASRHVKAVVTGDGGDELFAGYEKYAEFFKQTPSSNLEEDYFDSISLLSHEEKNDLYTDDFKIKMRGEHSFSLVDFVRKDFADHDSLNRALAVDVLFLLPGNNLVKPDRMGMAHSLEARTPFLDYRMVEFAFSLPGNLKLKNGETKYILKKAVEERIGEELTYRKKQMFTVPIGEWFKVELASFLERVLLTDKHRDRGIFQQSKIENLVRSHVSGSRNYTRILRALVSLELWFQAFVDRKDLKVSQSDSITAKTLEIESPVKGL
jgi:asparagine synthase (glutamine-hydrolysing)